MKKSFLLFILIGFVPALAQAERLEGIFTFSKRPPKVALVYLNNQKTVPQDHFIDQKNKTFTPALVTLPKGSSLIIRNSDEVDHNVYADDQQSGINFDIGLKEPGREEKVRQDWPLDKLVRLSCKIHPKMRAWVAQVPDSRFQAIIHFKRGQKTARFTLEPIPKGVIQVRVLMPGYPAFLIDIAAGKKIELELVKKKQIRGQLALSRQ